MQGKRCDIPQGAVLNPCEYGLHFGIWFACTPNGLMANLKSHDVTEHEDGTITVFPSIKVASLYGKRIDKQWHGYLERGVWREV